MSLLADAIRACLSRPVHLARSCADTAPDIVCAMLYYVDDAHVAVAANGPPPQKLAALLTHPETAARYQMALRHRATLSEGSVLDAMRARNAAVASQLGKGGASETVAAELYAIEGIAPLAGATLPERASKGAPLRAVRELSRQLAGADDLSRALDMTLDGLVDILGVEQAMALCTDESGRWLYTVASRGYPQSGVGSEIMVGDGVIGAAARYRSTVRLSCAGSDISQLRSPRAGTSTDIPFPGLAEPQSQLAAPVVAGNWLAGVLYVESQHSCRFSHHDEDALAAIGHQLGLAMRLLVRPAEAPATPEATVAAPAASAGSPMVVRYFATTQSVFLGDDYLIKGVAGAVLWLLLNDCQHEGRTDFSNRELRLDPRLRLPELDDNLETRLLLLQRRLAERCDWLGLEKLGRGRFRLRLEQAVRLIDVEG